MKNKKFGFYVQDKKNSDTEIMECFNRSGRGKKEVPVIVFGLPYTAPYNVFTGIKEFQLETKYRPFTDGASKHAVAVIDVTEWLGHEDEEYLEVFMKFLHDYDATFFDFNYVFTARDADVKEIEAMFELAAEYFVDGEYIIQKDNNKFDMRGDAA